MAEVELPKLGTQSFKLDLIYLRGEVRRGGVCVCRTASMGICG